TLPDELAECAGELQSRISGREQWEANFQSLNDMVAVAGSDYESMSTALSGNRKIASVKLDNAVRSELVPLKMGLTEFNTEISASKPGPGGIDAVRFVVSTNPGSPAGPLDRIASGGELSRFLLALKVCLIREGGPDTMIFDEIDSGIGGATADAVGRRLAMLAEDRQIVVVTHSPQVAARGSYHWRVAKRVENGQTISFATPVAGDERVNEIARMLSGSKITNEARAAAEKLMVE
ncbi:MAG: DNA repair protein RecN, partial [Roseovarius sp.]|nr:DNA repair protein RecN [Roseovarius sp.]